MIVLFTGDKLLSHREVLDNVVRYIHNTVGTQDHLTHINDICGYLAAGLNMNEDEVRGYMIAAMTQIIKEMKS